MRRSIGRAARGAALLSAIGCGDAVVGFKTGDARKGADGAAGCGNGACEPGETCIICKSDCPCVCGDDACNPGENCYMCAADCGACMCGDGKCVVGETCALCSECECFCGDGACTAGEDSGSCPADCPKSCGNDVCDVAESCATCPSDCGPCGCTGTAEVCDLVDNDCDGVVDNGFLLGVLCDGPDGDMCDEGMTVCAPGGDGVVCSDMTGTSTETCNGLDDDCDGEADEDFGLCMSCCDAPDDDLCIDDAIVCLSPSETECVDMGDLIQELCNGVDDTCDGTVDEGYGLCTDCCDAPGGDLCLDDDIVCTGLTTSGCVDVGGEVILDCCDGIDSDCDGQVDEDCGPYGCP